MIASWIDPSWPGRPAETFRHVLMERLRYRIAHSIDPRVLGRVRVSVASDELAHVADCVAHSLVARMEADLLSREVKVEEVELARVRRTTAEISIPATWWDGFKAEVLLPLLAAWDRMVGRDPWWGEADRTGWLRRLFGPRLRVIATRSEEHRPALVRHVYTCPHLGVESARPHVAFLAPTPGREAEERERHLFLAAARYAAEAVAAADRDPRMMYLHDRDDLGRFRWAMATLKRYVGEIDRL